MNKRLVVAVGAILLLTLLVIFWVRQKPSTLTKETPSKPVVAEPEHPTPTLGSKPEPTATSQVPSIPPGETKESWGKRVAKVESAIESSNVPISFWGKVVDQSGSPIEGVKVSYRYTTEHVGSPGVAWSVSQQHSAETQTNNLGLFSVSDVRGSYLAVQSLEKPNYVSSNSFSSNGQAYNYNGKTSAGAFTPKQNDPVVFVMIRKDAVESLVHFSTKVDLPGDGAPVRVALASGKQDNGGELQLRLQRSPASITSGQGFKWEISVQVLGGGIQRFTEAASFIAPEQGYEANGLAWTFDKSRSFFLRSASGKFERLNLTVYADDVGSVSRCYIEGYFNPSGSRNLEYDSKKEIAAKK